MVVVDPQNLDGGRFAELPDNGLATLADGHAAVVEQCGPPWMRPTALRGYTITSTKRLVGWLSAPRIG